MLAFQPEQINNALEGKQLSANYGRTPIHFGMFLNFSKKMFSRN
jgi:hypothetical protein